MNDLNKDIDLVIEILLGCKVDGRDNWARLLTACNKLEEMKTQGNAPEVKSNG